MATPEIEQTPQEIWKGRLHNEIGDPMRIFPAVLLLVAVGGTAFAQDSETTTPKPAEPSLTVDVPPGGCMPFGVTAAGDLVFPIQCKELIERRRGGAVEDKAAVQSKACRDRKAAAGYRSCRKCAAAAGSTTERKTNRAQDRSQARRK
jgi:hypothetical protein